MKRFNGAFVVFRRFVSTRFIMKIMILLVCLVVLAVIGGALFGAAYTDLFFVGVWQCFCMSVYLKKTYEASKKQLRPVVLWAWQPVFFSCGVLLGLLGRGLVC
jgi:hypothetical protein